MGTQKLRENTAYRLLDFCVQCPIEDGLLLYNAMTLELLLLSPEEADKLMELEDLVFKWFLVPVEQDDRLLADQLLEIVTHVQKPKENITSYTIFTTTGCNARCYYCFEQGFVRKNMSRDTANRLVKYIAAHSGEKAVNLHWFGGEPLVNQEAIDIICRGLTDAGVPYRSSMVSNGYLFDEDTIQKAVTSWLLSSVQITLDGTEDVYNRTKAYIRPDGSPFQRVLNNIELLIEAGIWVSVRLNVSEENWQDLLRLADQLTERFGGRKGFSVYSCPLYDQVESEQGDREWVGTRKASLLRKHREVRNHLVKLGLYHDKKLSRTIRTHHCMADNDGAVTVLPDGSLGRCEHFADSELFGHIDRQERDEAVISDWKEHTSPGTECSKCLYYPQCIRLKKCPGERICTADEREDIENQLRSQILNEYRVYMKQKAAREEDDPMLENC